MSADEPLEARGIVMGERNVEELLESQGHGTLSLVRDGDAYGVPVSFGFDGERLFLYLIQFGDSGKKFDFIETTETACLTTYTAESKFKWKSAIVTGTLRTLDDDEIDYMESVMDENAWFPGIFPPTEAVTGVRRTEMEILEATGRMGVDYQ